MSRENYLVVMYGRSAKKTKQPYCHMSVIEANHAEEEDVDAILFHAGITLPKDVGEPGVDDMWVIPFRELKPGWRKAISEEFEVEKDVKTGN